MEGEPMNLHAKSQQLLESLANSVLDRCPKSPVFFTTHESHVIEEFLRDFVYEVKNKIGDY